MSEDSLRSDLSELVWKLDNFQQNPVVDGTEQQYGGQVGAAPLGKVAQEVASPGGMGSA